MFNGTPTAIYGDGYFGTDDLNYSAAFSETEQAGMHRRLRQC